MSIKFGYFVIMKIMQINKIFTKREELVAASIVQSAFLFFSILVPFGTIRFAFIAFLVVLTYVVAIIFLRENIEKFEFFVLPVLPVLFTVSSALFYSVIPERWLTRFGFIGVYGILIYSIFLTENVFNVSKLKNIQLLKVARTISFFISCFSIYIFTYFLLSLRINGFFAAILLWGYVLLMGYSYIWSFVLNLEFDKYVFRVALSTASLLTEFYIVISFWPLNIYLTSLFITSIYYFFFGVLTNILEYRTRGWNKTEFLLINLVVFIFCLLTVNFG